MLHLGQPQNKGLNSNSMESGNMEPRSGYNDQMQSPNTQNKGARRSIPGEAMLHMGQPQNKGLNSNSMEGGNMQSRPNYNHNMQSSGMQKKGIQESGTRNQGNINIGSDLNSSTQKNISQKTSSGSEKEFSGGIWNKDYVNTEGANAAMRKSVTNPGTDTADKDNVREPALFKNVSAESNKGRRGSRTLGSRKGSLSSKYTSHFEQEILQAQRSKQRQRSIGSEDFGSYAAYVGNSPSMVDPNVSTYGYKGITKTGTTTTTRSSTSAPRKTLSKNISHDSSVINSDTSSMTSTSEEESEYSIGQGKGKKFNYDQSTPRSHNQKESPNVSVEVAEETKFTKFKRSFMRPTL